MYAVIGGGGGKGSGGTAAQEVVSAALLHNARVPKAFNLPPGLIHVAQRFMALAPKLQRNWLAGHLLALRSGHVTLAEIP